MAYPLILEDDVLLRFFFIITQPNTDVQKSQQNTEEKFTDLQTAVKQN